MFHEGNLRNADVPEVKIEGVSGKFGLLQQWVERIVAEINKYMDWPLVSKKMDDLADTYILRLNQKKCQPQYTMVIDDSSLNINEIKVASTTGECKVPLFAIRNAEFDESTVKEVEQRGIDPATAWIEINNTPKSIKFTKDVKWNDDAYTNISGSGHMINYSWKILAITLAVVLLF